MYCTRCGITMLRALNGDPYCPAHGTGERDATIPPAVREAAVRLNRFLNTDACDHIKEYKGQRADIILICQHVLGRE